MGNVYKLKIDKGEKYGFFTVLGEADRTIISGNPMRTMKCLCSCGRIVNVLLKNLRSGGSKSCGCKKVELSSKHGMYKSPTYQSWHAMKTRCNNKNHVRYHCYGGRGITVCDAWDDFINFYSDMGERPEGKTLDRINNNGNYCPENCRWSTPKQQAQNRAKKMTYVKR